MLNSRQSQLFPGCVCVVRKMPTKTFDCNKYNGHHIRPINSKCQKVSQNNSSSSDRPEGLSQDLSVKILQELQALRGRMTTIEDRVNQQDQATTAVASPTRSQTSTTTSEPESDLMLPTMDALRRSSTVQAEYALAQVSHKLPFRHGCVYTHPACTQKKYTYQFSLQGLDILL